MISLQTFAAVLGISGAGALSFGNCLIANALFSLCNPILILLFLQQNAQAQVLQFCIYEGLALVGLARQLWQDRATRQAGAV